MIHATLPLHKYTIKHNRRRRLTLEQASLMMAMRQFSSTIDMVKTNSSSRMIPMMGLWLL